VLPTMPLPPLSRRYGQSIHADYRGRWHYDLRWKPIEGFKPNAGWLRAIHRAQEEVARGLAIACPVLVLHAARSFRPTQWTEEIRAADIVLDITDMQRLAPRLGKNVEIHAIDGGIHDLTLSDDPAQARMFALLAEWLLGIVPGSTGSQPVDLSR
jgi:alpha-beta hydrolase superfamily lysophospholipase